jgi:hypothetical protein
MTLAMQMRIDELIDAHRYSGGIIGAIESRKRVIARRKLEGKESPRATEELEILISLPYNYKTETQMRAPAPLSPDYL